MSDAVLALLQGRSLADAPPQLVQLVERAVERERVTVELADGSSLSLDDAERLLARKEEQRAYRPLRQSIDGALRPFRQFNTYETDGALAGFLSDTRELAAGATETLATLAGEPLFDATTLARALDLPGFDGKRVLSLIGQVRDAVGAGRIAAVKVPRALAGLAFLDGAIKRFAVVEPAYRFDRCARTLRAGMAAIAGGRDARAEALALGCFTPSVWGGSSRDAERVARVAACASLLRVRGLVALLSSDGDWRDALATHLGVGPDLAIRELVDEPLPPTRSSAQADVDSAAVALMLRDAFDERFALAPDALHIELSPRQDAAKAWREWLGPWL